MQGVFVGNKALSCGGGTPAYLDTDDGDVNWHSDDENGVPDYLEPLTDALARTGLTVQGGRPIGCHVGVVSQGGPASALLLVLTLCLGIRRYWRN